MALSYRSPVEEVLSSFTTTEQSTISAIAVQGYKELESSRFKFFNYVMPAMAKQKLIESGIYLSPFSAVPHSHPVCKTLENYFLYQVLPSYVDNSFYFVGMKQGKLEFLKSRYAHTSAIECLNRLVTSKDKFRYPSTFCIQRPKEPISVEMLQRHKDVANHAALKTLIPEVIKLKSRKLFMHDELHYWGIDELTTFLEVVKPEILLGTLVYPPELLAGSRESLNKWCYEYEISGNELFFYPDGVKSEGYIQPKENGYLLKTRRIVLLDGTNYTVNLLHSRFSHHLISITKDELATPSYNCFSGFDAVSGEALEPLMKDSVKALPISYNTVSKIYRYLRTLVKPDSQSAMAKLGQLVPEPTAFEIKFVQEFSELVIKSKQVNSMINSNLYENFFVTLIGTLPHEISRRSKKFREWTLDDFVRSMEAYSFKVKLETIKCGLPDYGLSHNSVAEEGYDLIANLDKNFFASNGQTIPEMMERSGESYVSSENFVDELEMNEASVRFLVKILSRYYVNSLRLFNNHVVNSTKVINQFVAFLQSRAFTFYYSFRIDKEIIRKVALAVQYICIKEKKFCRNYFRNNPRKWFYGGRRMYMRFIDGGEVKSSLNEDAIRCYKNCISELMNLEKPIYSGVPVKSIIAERNEDCEFDGSSDVEGSQETTHSGESESEKEEAEKEEPEEITAQKRLIMALKEEAMSARYGETACVCGCKLGVGRTVGCSLLQFELPDRLYNRNCGWYSKISTCYNYNGGTHNCLGWNDSFDKFVGFNGFADFGFDCVLVQEYDEGAKIGFHSDDEVIFDPSTPILTVVQTGSSVFKVKCGKVVTEFNLNSSDYLLMPENFQSHHKHSVSNCSKGRISLTFRRLNRSFYKSDSDCVGEVNFGGEDKGTNDVKIDEWQTIVTSEDEDVKFTDGLTAVEILGVELTCRKGASIEQFKVEQVPGDGHCFWHSVGYFMGISGFELKNATRTLLIKELNYDPELQTQMEGSNYSENEAIAAFCRIHCVRLTVYDQDRDLRWRFTPHYYSSCMSIVLANLHFNPLLPRNDCVLEAVAESLGRPKEDLLKVLLKKENSSLREELYNGEGVEVPTIARLLSLFSIRGLIDWDGELEILNPNGVNEACFEIKDDHMVFLKKDMSHYCRPKVVLEGRASKISLKGLESAGNRKEYIIEEERARRLARLLHEGNTGAISSELFNEERNILENATPEQIGRFGQSIEVTAIVGTFGAGKSTLFKKFFNQNPGKKIYFVSPRKALAEEFKVSIFGKNSTKLKNGRVIVKKDKRNAKWNVQTFEIFLKKISDLDDSCTIILDEMQLYPPGYLDLVLTMIPKGAKLFLVGDPCQSDYDSDKDRAAFSGVEGDFIKLLNGQHYDYVVKSRRFRNQNYLNRIPCRFDKNNLVVDEPYLMLNGMEELVNARDEFKENILVSSFDEKKIIKAYIKNDHTCCTFGESTGRTFQNVTIIITQNSSMVSERRWITAISRAAINICFVNLTGVSFESLALEYQGRALGNFLSGKASEDDLRKFLPGKPTFVECFGGKIGRDYLVREEKLRGDPWLKTMIELAQKEDQEAEELQEEICQEPWFKTHLPKCELEGVRAQWLHRLMAKEDRELRIRELVSNQFTDQHSKNRGIQLTNAAERFEAIYPRHRANDTVTFLMAVRKRLRFSKPQIECGKLRQAELYGKYLLDIFLKLVPLKSSHNKNFMEKALSDFFDKKTSKSAAVIENHAGRSCRDWLADVGLVFMKSQLCTKFEKRFAMAKAAQTIVCFQHSVLCRFAPYMRYIEMKLHEVLPSKFYIHSGKGLNELNDWVKKNNFSGMCTESDYEAFDASQDEYIVAFELALMKYLGLPKDLIEDYRYIKTHLGSKLGSFSIMRFSGEASTFLFNTMANMLFTFMRYDLNGKESICFAGDDMCASKSLRLSMEHEEFLSKLKLKAKVDKTRKPTFCGWHLSEDGIYKKPQLVLERMCIARETNNLQNCLDNYAIEVSFAYLLGEKAVCRMNEEELNSYYNCVRIIVKNKHLLKSDVARVFESA